MKWALSLGLIVSILSSCISEPPVLQIGTWRLLIKGAHGDIPALIEVQDQQSIFLIRGEEKFKLDRLATNSKSEIRLGMHIYDSELILKKISENNVSGIWLRNDKVPVQEYNITMEFGKKTLFEQDTTPESINLSGKWKWTFDPETEKESVVLGILRQNGNKVEGSLATPTGDYGLMQGFVFKNNFKLATFDGVFAFTINGTQEADVLKGEFTTLGGVKKFIAVKDANYSLPDPSKQTKLLKNKKIDFELPSLSGDKVSLESAKYKNKPVILQIYGSWCPNCLDEVKFLSKWYKDNKHKGIEILALSFERTTSIERAKANIQKSIERFSVDYDFVIASFDNSLKPDQVLPIENFISFPTTLFLNSKHEVIKIHAGFSGPATGDEYDKFLNFFNLTIQELI
jgi:thiol-disulfide isomerase/thioredoxin